MKKSIRSTALFVAAYLAVMILGASCQPHKEKTSSVIRLGVMSSMDFLPFALAEELGYYDSLGLEVEVVPFFSANERDVALQNGQIDATVTDYTGAVLQKAGGVDAAMLMSLDGVFTWVGKKPNWVDYQGASVAVSNKTVIDYVTDLLLHKKGPDAVTIRKTEVNKIPLRLEMLRSGEIDASVFPDPFTTIATSEGALFALANTQDIERKVTCLFVQNQFARENQEAIGHLVEGYNKAVDELPHIDRTLINEVLIKHSGANEKIAPLIRLPRYQKATPPRVEDVKDAIRWLEEQGALVPGAVAEKDLISTFLLNK